MRRSVSSGPRPGVAVSQGILLSCPFSSTPGVPPASPGGWRGLHGPQLFGRPGELARELRGGARGAGSSCQEAWGCCQGGHPCLPCTPSLALRAVSRAPLMKVARRGPLLPSGAPTSQFPGPPGGFITACTGARGTEKGLGLTRLPRSPHGRPPDGPFVTQATPGTQFRNRQRRRGPCTAGKAPRSERRLLSGTFSFPVFGLVSLPCRWPDGKAVRTRMLRTGPRHPLGWAAPCGFGDLVCRGTWIQVATFSVPGGEPNGGGETLVSRWGQARP